MPKYVRLLTVIALVCLPAWSWAQSSIEKVAGPTRLDWEYAVKRFGPGSARLAKDYNSAAQKYQLFVPARLDKNKPAPLVLFISPGNNPSGLSAWKKVCEEQGVIFCSPYAAGNPVPVGQRTRIVFDVLDDVRRKYSIDPLQTYLSGFSGGGRMACALGFALPEYFGGIVPVCGINTPSSESYLRHRAEDRLSVALVTGAKDFNRKENERFMAPLLKDLGIRGKLWVVPGLGHGIPSAATMAEVYAWLLEDLPRRRKDAEAHPELSITAKEAPAEAEQGQRMLKAARKSLDDTKGVWRGIALLQGIRARWPKSQAGLEAVKMLGKATEDRSLLEAIAEQGARDEQKSLRAHAQAYASFGLTARAIDAWQKLADNYPNTPIAREASEQINRLRKQ